jgi:hypothetical protein
VKSKNDTDNAEEKPALASTAKLLQTEEKVKQKKSLPPERENTVGHVIKCVTSFVRDKGRVFRSSLRSLFNVASSTG